MTRVAILGTGLIGASIGLRLRSMDRNGLEIYGFDRYGDVGRQAQKIGAIDRVVNSPQQAAEGSDLIIIAAPVLAIRRLLEEIAPVVSEDAVITDTGSTKAEVLRWFDDYLPRHPGFVGGHPMAGKVDQGPGAADPALFEGARWVISPPVRTSQRAIDTVLNLIEMMGAESMIMDPDEHDAYTAAISHMPMLAAVALFSMERASAAWPELSLLASSGFRDMTRLANTDAAMSYDIAVTNRDNTLHWLDRYIESLREIRDRLADQQAEEDFFKLLAATEFEYDAFRHGKVGREEKGPDTDTSFSFQDFIAGAWVRERIQDMMKDSEDRMRQIEERDRTRRDV